MNDLRIAVRTLARTPVSSVLIVAMLGVGLGGSAAIFSLFDAVLLRPLAVPHPEQLVRMVQRLPKLPPRSNFDYAYYAALRDHAGSFQQVFGETDDGIFLRMSEPAAQQVSVHAVTPEFFQGLGAKPYWGRTLREDDDGAVLSYAFWRRHFADDPKAMAGRSIVVNGHRLPIVGVMPRDFNGLSADTSPDIRVPLKACPVLLDCKVDSVSLQLAGRLKPGVSVKSAEQECLAIWNTSMRDFYQKTRPEIAAVLLKRGMNLETLARGTSVLRDRASDVLKLLMAGAALLVLIIGLNVAGLLVARAAARRQEMAVKLAIGASPLRLAWQMAVESFVLAVLAAITAVCVTLIATPLALRLVPPVRSLYTVIVPLSVDVRMNGRVLLYLALMTIVTTLVFTISPALATLRMSIDSVLRTVRSGSGLRGRQLLIALQIALCTCLLVCAAELARSFQQLASVPSGFANDSVATFTCELEGYKTAPAFAQKLKERLLQLPGVDSVATASMGVMREHGQFADIVPAGRQLDHADFMATTTNEVSPGYFKTMGVQLRAGRDFTAAEVPAPRQPTEAIVNEAFVRRFFEHKDPLGQRFGYALEGSIAKPDFEIIGVVSDTKYRSLKDPIRPMFFSPQTDFESFVLNVRTSIRPEAIIGPVQQAAASVAPDLPFLEVNTLAREVAATTAPERTTAVLSSLFGVVAALIAGVGTYGLLTYSVQQRRREIGIRMAIGAQQTDVVKLVARQTLAMTVSGVAVGLAAALLAGRAIRSVLYGLSASDPVSFLSAGLIVALVALLATVGPVLYATGIKPSEALRVDS
jgi:predicted permease